MFFIVGGIMKYILLFVFAFTIIYLFYLFTVILQKKRYDKFKESNQVMFFVKRYKLDKDKINIKKFINVISLVNSFIIAISFTVSSISSNFIIELLIGLLVIVPLMLLSYHVIGISLKKEEEKWTHKK